MGFATVHGPSWTRVCGHGPSWTLSTSYGPVHEPSMSPWTLMDPFNSLLATPWALPVSMDPHGPFNSLWAGPWTLRRAHGPSWTLPTPYWPAHGPSHVPMDPYGPFQQPVSRPMDPFMVREPSWTFEMRLWVAPWATSRLLTHIRTTAGAYGPAHASFHESVDPRSYT